MKHSGIQRQLYEYVHDELAEQERQTVEQHVRSCPQCAEELAQLKSTLSLFTSRRATPSEERDEAYWNTLSRKIEAQIPTQVAVKTSPFAGLYERILSFLTLRPGYGFALGAGLSIGIVALVVLQMQTDNPVHTADNISNDRPAVVQARNETDQRVSRYFSKSKTLLVGLANLPEEESKPDLSAEQRLSLKLVKEARYLQQQPLDGRSAKLIADLEKILIELANLEEGTDLPNVELIRSGIKRENLLFKIRMAEEAFDTTKSSIEKKFF